MSAAARCGLFGGRSLFVPAAACCGLFGVFEVLGLCHLGVCALVPAAACCGLFVGWLPAAACCGLFVFAAVRCCVTNWLDIPDKPPEL